MKISILLLVALAASVALRRQSAALRHWILAVAFACAAAMPLLSVVLPSWHVTLAPLSPAPAAAPDASIVSTTFTLQNPAVRSGQAADAGPATGATPRETMVVWLERFWIAGAAVSFMVLGIGLARLRRLASRARRLESGHWVDLTTELRRALGLRRSVALLQSDHPALLVTWGFVRPKILLPAGAQAWPAARARVVLQHELEHIRRGDWIVQLVGEILRAVYWFNPLVWIACRRLRCESEHACDDAVLNGGVEPTDYASLLVDLARTLTARRRIHLPAPAMARASSLEGRVSAMLNARLNRSPLTRSTRIATVILLLGLTLPMSGLAAQKYSKLSGTVRDQTNGFLPGTRLALVNKDTQAKYEVRTDRTGHFEFVGLPDGEYTLDVLEMGFAPFTDSLTITGRDVSRTIELELGSLTETITLRSGGGKPTATLPEKRAEGRQWSEAKRQQIAERCGSAAGTGGMGGNILQPIKIVDVKPVYPEGPVPKSGLVVLDAIIGTDGTVRELRTVSAADPDLERAATDAVRQWEFSTTYLNCTPVDVRMRVTANFVAQQ